MPTSITAAPGFTMAAVISFGRPTAANLNWRGGSGPTPNQVTAGLSAIGTLSIYNNAGTVDIVVDAAAYLTGTTPNRMTAVEIGQRNWSVDRGRPKTIPVGDQPIDAVFDEWVLPWSQRQVPPISKQVIYFLRMTTKVVVATMLGMTALKRAGFDVMSVITGLGIGGLAVALAAQETLGNILGSVQIMTDRPFVAGDHIRVETFFGRVTEVGMRSTKLVTPAGVCVVIPNKRIAGAAIENFTQSHGRVHEFTLGLVYSSTTDQVRQATAILNEILREQPSIHLEGSVVFHSLTESALTLRVVYVVDPDDFGPTLNAVNLAIHERFAAAGLQFAFPTRTLHVSDEAARLLSGARAGKS